MDSYENLEFEVQDHTAKSGSDGFGEYKLIPADELLVATLRAVEKKTVNYNDKFTGEPKSFDKLEWTFEITEGEFAGRRLRGQTDAYISTHPSNRFRPWAEAMLGMELQPGVKFTVGDLIGKRCEISVVHVPSRKDPEKLWEQIDEVLPVEARETIPF